MTTPLIDLTRELFSGFDIEPIHVDPFGILHAYPVLKGDLALRLKSLLSFNRPLDEVHVERLYRDMKHGNFTYLCEPVHIDRNGKVFNYRHRLEAFLRWQAETPDASLPIEICVGFSHIASEKLDNTKVRTKYQDLRSHDTKYASTFKSAIPYIIAYLETGDFSSYAIDRVTSSDIRDFVNANPDFIEKMTPLASSQKRAVVPTPWLVTMRYILDKVDEVDSEIFVVDQVLEGKGLNDGMPAYEFRKWMVGRDTGRFSENRVVAWTLAKMFLKYQDKETVPICRAARSMPYLGL